MHYSQLSPIERLGAARLALTNAMLPELQPYLLPFAYGPDRIAEGEALRVAAEELHYEAGQARTDAQIATDAQNATRKAAHRVYMRHVKLARIVLPDPALGRELGLDARRERALLPWLDQAHAFYTRALAHPEAAARLAAAGADAEALQAGLDGIEAVRTARAERQTLAARSVSMTAARDEALGALGAWMADFFAIARLAFEDDPQRMESLGVVVPS